MMYENFRNYLENQNIDKQKIPEIIEQCKDYEEFLLKEDLNLERSPPEKIIEYSEYLLSKNGKTVLDFLRSIIQYANYSKKYEFITKVIDISESYKAMDNLYLRIGEIYGENQRDEIFKNLKIPELGVNPEKKPEFTKTILKRIEEKLGKRELIELLSPCLHGRPPDNIEKDKKILNDLGIDGFLEKKHEELIERLEKHRKDGTLEFAQEIDDDIVQHVKENQMIAEGIREGDIIYVSKLPYQMRKFLDAENDRLKRFFICYCPWVRGTLKSGTEKEITNDFCHCSAGWYKLYWDQIFEESVVVEPIETALKGDYQCKFAIHVPKNYLLSLDDNQS